MSRYLRLALITSIGLSCVLLFLLVSASQNSNLFEKYYSTLLWINTGVMLFFLGLVGILLGQLYKNAKRKKYGVKILSRFALALCVTGVIPGVLIFAVSVQFLHKSLDSWFDIRVERALDSGLTLGREVLENFEQILLNKAKSIALEISESPPSSWVSALDAAREKAGVQEAVLVSSGGNFLGVSGLSLNKLAPTVPSVRVLQIARSAGHWKQIEETNSGELHVRVLLPVSPLEISSSFSLSSPKGKESSDNSTLSLKKQGTSEGIFLEVVDRVPPSLASNAEALMNGYRDYQEMMLARDGLTNIYLISLTLVLLLSMFGSIAISVIMANRISKPLMLLLEGTRRVGGGQYEMLPEANSNDEVAELTRSFNKMTLQLSETRQDLERRGDELGQAKNYLERILAKMSSGVIVLDHNWRLVSANSSASRILKFDLTSRLGDLLGTMFPEFVDEIKQRTAALSSENMDISFQREFSFSDKSHWRLTIFARGSQLPLGDSNGYLVVFDDVTALVSAQRTEAWGEVARRLAHEIKNPLTPIQLAAERLQMKLEDKVEGKEKNILNKATATIVDQVTAMKQMVDDFRLYAKIGTPHYEKLNLAEFVEEVSSLYQVAGLRIHLNLDFTAPLIEADTNQLRQIIHNLLSNAMEASPDKDAMRVSIKVFKLDPKDEQSQKGVGLEVSDSGPGFNSEILEHAFEPYVTTKPSGTGLGLAMIKKIVEEHGASVTVGNNLTKDGNVQGARVLIIFSKLIHDSK